MLRIILSLSLTFATACVYSQVITATIKQTQAPNHTIGTITFTDTDYGLLITPNLHGLSPGPHGFHLHRHPSCNEHGMKAGSHYDPQNTHSHQGPYGQGHLGDLPVLWVSKEGAATTPVLAPRLQTSNLKQRSIMIHAGGDTYSDAPKLGGGGTRVACGVIE